MSAPTWFPAPATGSNGTIISNYVSGQLLGTLDRTGNIVLQQGTTNLTIPISQKGVPNVFSFNNAFVDTFREQFLTPPYVSMGQTFNLYSKVNAIDRS